MADKEYQQTITAINIFFIYSIFIDFGQMEFAININILYLKQIHCQSQQV
jgi:hypothetical protein